MDPVLSRWNGSAWVAPTSVNAWNGSAWVAATVNNWDGTQWVSGGGTTPPTPPPSPPTFVDVAGTFNGGVTGTFDITLTKPSGDTLLAMLTWNAAATIDVIPSGWTPVDSAAGSTSGAAVFSADSSVTDMTWSLTATGKVSAIVLGYTKAVVVGHASATRTASVVTSTAPTVTVTSGDAPATVVRLFWEKSSVATAASVASATRRGTVQFSTGNGNSAIGADSTLSVAGATGTSVASYDGPGSAQGGGFTVVLSSKSFQ